MFSTNGHEQDRELVAASGSRTPGRWFDTSVYSLPTGGIYGNAARRTIEGPGTQNLDFSLLRSFSIHEEVRMEFRFEAFNILNHTNFRSPDLWENAVAPVSVIGTAGEGVDELEVGTGVRQFGGVELGQ